MHLVYMKWVKKMHLMNEFLTVELNICIECIGSRQIVIACMKMIIYSLHNSVYDFGYYLLI